MERKYRKIKKDYINERAQSQPQKNKTEISKEKKNKTITYSRNKDKEKDKDKEKSKKKKMKVKIKDYEQLKTVGLGSYGRVRLCKNKKTGEIFVMKILKKNDIIKQKQVDSK